MQDAEGIDVNKVHGLRGSTIKALMAAAKSRPVAGAGIDVQSDGESETWSVRRPLPPCHLSRATGGGLAITPFRLVKRLSATDSSEAFVPRIGTASLDTSPAPLLSVPPGGGGVYLEYGASDGQISAAATPDDLPASNGEQYFQIAEYVATNSQPTVVWSWAANVIVNI